MPDHRRERPSFLAIILALAATCAAAHAVQPDAAPPPTPEAVLRAIHDRYRAGPVCERLSFEVRSLTGRAARSSLICRIGPGLGADNSILLSLDLGGLRVSADAARLIAAHARDDQTYYASSAPLPSLTSDGLAAVLPPILLPPLDFASTPAGTTLDSFPPYARRIVWDTVEPSLNRPSRVTMKGRHDAGDVTLEADAGRPLSLTITRRPGTTIALRFAELAPCDPITSAINTAGRTRVAAIDELRPRAAVLRLGVVAPPLPLSTGPGEVWSMEDFLQTPAEFVPGPACEHFVLLFTRVDGPTPQGPGPLSLKTDFDRLGGLMKQLRTDSFSPPPPAPPADPAQPPSPLEQRRPLKPLNFALVLVLDSPAPEDVLERLAPLTRVWGPNLLWTTSAPGSIDILLGQTAAGFTVLDAEGVLRAASPVAAVAAPESIERDIRATLEALTAGLQVDSPPRER
jgi:hypothetical protein